MGYTLKAVLFVAFLLCLTHSEWVNGVEVTPMTGTLTSPQTADKNINYIKSNSLTEVQLVDFEGNTLQTITLSSNLISIEISYDSHLLIVALNNQDSLQIWYATRNSNSEDFSVLTQFNQLTAADYLIVSSSSIVISKDNSVFSYVCDDGKVRWVKLVDNGDGTYSETLSAVSDELSSTDVQTTIIYISDNGNYLAYTTTTTIKVISLEGTQTSFSQAITSGASLSMSSKESGKFVVAVIANDNLEVYTFDPSADPEFVKVYDLSTTAPFAVSSSGTLHVSDDGTLLTVVEGNNVFLGVTGLGSDSMDIYWSDAFTLSDQAIFRIQNDFGEYFILPELRSQAQLTDCSHDEGSTGQTLRNGQCQCLLGYYWDSENLLCRPTCNTKYAESVSTDDSSICACKTGTVWDDMSRTCVIDCISIQYATGQWLSEEVCECDSHSVWNTSSLSCKFDCGLVSSSTGLEVQPEVCECPIRTKWKAESTSCVIDCDAISHSIEDDSGNCLCETGFNMVDGKCITTDCSVIQYNDETSVTADGDCGCIAGFKWVREFGECVIECDSGLVFNTGQNAGVHECQCESHAFWNVDSLKCYRNCEYLHNADGNVDEDSCACESGYTWVADFEECLPQCLQANGEDGTRNDNGFCNCAVGFEANPLENQCYLDCSLIPNAKAEFGPSPLQCNCQSNFMWNSLDSTCDLACQGPFDTTVFDDNGVDKCQCETNTFYSTSLHTCELKCTSDTLAKGYDSVNLKCFCKSYAEWVESTNSCECIESYEQSNGICVSQSISTGAATAIAFSSVVLAGLTAFGGIKMYQKKKNEKTQQEIVEVDEKISQTKPTKSESAKNLDEEKVV